MNTCQLGVFRSFLHPTTTCVAGRYLIIILNDRIKIVKHLTLPSVETKRSLSLWDCSEPEGSFLKEFFTENKGPSTQLFSRFLRKW